MTEFIGGAHQSETHQKALRINLDPRWYGTIAEIGAGQEVVRWFFRVGGAAGTVAKSIGALPPFYAADLLATFSPFDRSTMERAFDQFLGRLDDLETDLMHPGETTSLVPWVMTSAALLSLAEMVHRRVRDTWEDSTGMRGGEEATLIILPNLPGRWDSEGS